MKTLYILRHAKSSWKDDDLDDFDRPLNKRGNASAVLLGEWLRGEGLQVDHILCSSARRTRSTVKRILADHTFSGDITYHTDLYLAAPDVYIRLLKKLPNTVNSAMVVGHNPGLEALVEYLCASIVAMPTAALAIVELPIVEWEDLELNGKAKLLRVWRPAESNGDAIA